jgi:flagellar biosynthetic protein FliP
MLPPTLPASPAQGSAARARPPWPAPRRAPLSLIAAGLFAAAFLLALIVPLPAVAQEVTLTLAEGGSLTTRSIQLLLLVTVLGLVPGLAVMITCFPFIVTVLSILRQAIGLQTAPPNMLIISLALFLTWFVMDPVFTAAWSAGIEPLSAGRHDIETAITEALRPFRGFMAARLDPDTFAALEALRPLPPDTTPTGGGEVAADFAAAPLSLLVPSFLLSEIARAFEIGFLIFLPFLVIDLVVAAILMSMGMMMVPPAIVALPFKLAFFVVADGWSLISAALVRSYF